MKAPYYEISDNLLYYIYAEDFIDYKLIHLPNYKFNKAINAPADGHCLLYSFQIAYLYETGELIELDKIKHVLFKQYKKSIIYKNSGDFFAIDDSDRGINDRLVISSKWQDKINDNIEINKFYLINYLENKLFNTAIVDIIPSLLASSFNCKIKIFEYDDRNLFVRETFLPTPNSSTHSSKDSYDWDLTVESFFFVPPEEKTINILFIPSKLHYMAFTNSDRDIEFENIENLLAANGIRRSTLPYLLQDEFYKNVASNFEESNYLNVFYFYFNSYKCIKLKDTINLNIIYKYKAEKTSLNLGVLKKMHKMKYFSEPSGLIDTNKALESLIMLIEKSSNQDLISKFRSRFENKSDFIEFMHTEEVFPEEDVYFKKICKNFLHEIELTKELKDPKYADKKLKLENSIYNFVVITLKLCSMKGLYLKLDLKWQTYIEDLTLILKIPCQGIFVDREMGKFEVFITYDQESSDYFYSINENTGNFLGKVDTKVDIINEEAKNKTNYRVDAGNKKFRGKRKRETIDKLIFEELMRYKKSCWNKSNLDNEKKFKIKCLQSSESIYFVSLAIIFILLLAFTVYLIVLFLNQQIV